MKRTAMLITASLVICSLAFGSATTCVTENKGPTLKEATVNHAKYMPTDISYFAVAKFDAVEIVETQIAEAEVSTVPALSPITTKTPMIAHALRSCGGNALIFYPNKRIASTATGYTQAKRSKDLHRRIRAGDKI